MASRVIGKSPRRSLPCHSLFTSPASTMPWRLQIIRITESQWGTRRVSQSAVLAKATLCPPTLGPEPTPTCLEPTRLFSFSPSPFVSVHFFPSFVSLSLPLLIVSLPSKEFLCVIGCKKKVRDRGATKESASKWARNPCSSRPSQSRPTRLQSTRPPRPSQRRQSRRPHLRSTRLPRAGLVCRGLGGRLPSHGAEAYIP